MNLLLAVFRITHSVDNRKVWQAIAWRMAEALFATVPYGVLYVALQRMFSATFDLHLLLWLSLILLVSLGLQLVCNVASNVGGFIGGTGMLCDLRLQVAEHLRKLPLGFYTRRQTGDLTAVLAENATHVEEAFTHLTGELFGRLGIAALTATMMVLIDWRLGLLTLACAALGGGLIRLLKKRFQALGRAKLAQKAEVGSRLLEFVQGIKVIRAFGLSIERFGDIQAAMHTLRNLSVRIEIIAGLLAIGFSVLLEFGFLALLACSVYLAVQGELSQALLIMMLIMGHRFFSMMSESATLLAQLAFYEKSFERIQALLNEPCLPEPAQPQVPQRYDIEVRNLSFSHEPGLATLTDISFKAAAGTVTALVGESGSGKTTLAQLLARFHDADSGQVLVGGVDVRDMRQDDLLGCIAFVFQDTHLFNDSIANNLRIGRPQASDDELIAAARAACCHDFIMALPEGYDTQLTTAQALSGGERQRLSIARALLKDAPIVILDEATASLDAENESAIRQALSALMRGKTVIVIAHRLYTLTDVDQILVLEHTRVKEHGTHSQLLERAGLYAHFWAQQHSTRQWRLRAAAPPLG